MKKFFTFAILSLLGSAAIGGGTENWKLELEIARGQGIIFSMDNRVLLKCPQNVVSVKIPSCVSVIGHKAFAKCAQLSEVMIPESVKRIDAGAFTWCVALDKIEIPESVTVIGTQAFSRCKALTEIKIPAKVTEIGDGIFAGCDKLTSVTVGSSKTPAFMVDSSGALIDCKKQKLLYLPMGFSGIYRVPESVNSIGAVAFYCCRKLTGIKFSAGVKSIGGKAFYGCSSLTGIDIPEGVPAIGEWTFAKCVDLSEVTIPDSVVSIGKNAFYGCAKLTELQVGKDCKLVPGAVPCRVIRR